MPDINRQMDEIERRYTIDELAFLAGQSRRTIERRIADGTIPVVRLGPRDVRIRAADARRYLDGEPPIGSGNVNATVHPIRKEST